MFNTQTPAMIIILLNIWRRCLVRLRWGEGVDGRRCWGQRVELRRGSGLAFRTCGSFALRASPSVANPFGPFESRAPAELGDVAIVAITWNAPAPTPDGPAPLPPSSTSSSSSSSHWFSCGHVWHQSRSASAHSRARCCVTSPLARNHSTKSWLSPSRRYAPRTCVACTVHKTVWRILVYSSYSSSKSFKLNWIRGY